MSLLRNVGISSLSSAHYPRFIVTLSLKNSVGLVICAISVLMVIALSLLDVF